MQTDATIETATRPTVLYPLVRELPADIDTPISVYLKLRGLGPSFLLESVEGGERMARHSMIGVHPSAIIRSWRDRTVIEGEGRWEELSASEGDVLEVLRRRLPRYEGRPRPDLPRFTGGAVGYLGYDVVRSFERLPERSPDTLGLPEAAFMVCERLVIYDHVKHTLLIVAHARAAEGQRPTMGEAEAAIDEIAARLRRPVNLQQASRGAHPAPQEIGAAWGRAPYEDAVRRAKEYIAAGEIFQVVLSRRTVRRTSAEPFEIYRALRRVNPSPYMFYLELPDGLRLIGSSPEVLVRLEEGVIETRPLAGTRPRGAGAEADRALAADLLGDPKERAEHVMLVDLARNDVGRVAE